MEIGRGACCNNSSCLGFVKLKLATSNRNDLEWGKRGVRWQTQAELLGVLGVRSLAGSPTSPRRGQHSLNPQKLGSISAVGLCLPLPIW